MCRSVSHERWHEGRSLLIWTEQDAAFFSVSFFAFWKMEGVGEWGGGGLFLALVRAGATTLPILHTSLRNPSWKLSANFLFVFLPLEAGENGTLVMKLQMCSRCDGLFLTRIFPSSESNARDVEFQFSLLFIF